MKNTSPIRTLLLSVFAAWLLTGCTTPHMLVSSDLRTDGVMLPVKGRQGQLVNQKMSFGDYRTDQVKRSAIASYDLRFFSLEWMGAREKVSYTLHAANGQQADVKCLGKIRSKSLHADELLGMYKLPVVEDFLTVALKYQDLYTVSITPQDAANWQLMITNPADFRQDGTYRGILLSDAGDVLEVKAVRELDGIRNLNREVTGYEFSQNGKVVGAVEMLNNGQVWLRPSNNPQLQLALAGAASALLLQSNIENAMNQTATVQH